MEMVVKAIKTVPKTDEEFFCDEKRVYIINATTHLNNAVIEYAAEPEAKSETIRYTKNEPHNIVSF